MQGKNHYSLKNCKPGLLPYEPMAMENVSRLKVAFVAYGHTDYAISLCKNLSKYIDITLILMTSGNYFTDCIFNCDISKLSFGLSVDQEIIRTFIGERIAHYNDSGMAIIIVRTPSLRILKDYKMKNLKYIKDLADYIKINSFDVVHFNGSSGFQIYLHWFLRHMPKVYTIHDYLPHSGEWNINLIMLNKLFTRLNYQFIQHSKYLSENFIETYHIAPERVHTIYCGSYEVYKEYINNKIQEEQNTILFFGRISPYKGLQYLIEAIPKIKEKIATIKLIIAGKGNFWFDFEKKDEYEIHNYHLSNEELSSLIQRSALIVVPYTDATHSGVIMTAYAFNKPVVATAVGAIPEILINNITGKLVSAGNSAMIANAVIDLLLNPGKREQMKNNIKEITSKGKLSWDYASQQTINVYQKAMHQSTKQAQPKDLG